MNIIFMGTPDFATSTLTTLLESKHEVVACYSMPPKPAGRRGLKKIKSPVQVIAEKNNIPMFMPKSFGDTEARETFKKHNADVVIVVAYGVILPNKILNIPKFGCFNGHASILPKWRGAAPIQRAIMNGDKKTGVSIMKMEEGLDTGPVALTREVDITPDMNAQKVHDILRMMCAEMMVEVIGQLEDGTIRLEQQQGEASYAKKINKNEARIDWSQDCQAIQRLVMGLSPSPGAWCETEDGRRLKILSAEVVKQCEGKPGVIVDGQFVIACGGGGGVKATVVQKEGGRVMRADEMMRGGHGIKVGAVLR